MNYQQNEITQSNSGYLLNPYYKSPSPSAPENKSYSQHDNRLFDNSVNSNNYNSFCSSLNTCKMRPQASQIDQASYQLPKVNQDMPYLSDRDLFSQNTRVPQNQDLSGQMSQMTSGQMTLGQMTSGQMPSGQMPQMPSGQMSQMSNPSFAYDQTNQSYLSQFNLNIPNTNNVNNQKNMSIFDRTMENYGQRK